MNIREKSNFILATLESLFPNPRIPLSHENPFTLLIAVMLSAQCTDIVVNKVTRILFTIAADPYAMVSLKEQRLTKIIRPCGFFNNKAKAILGTSRMIIDSFGGKVPDAFEKLESLPGVGHKTASVVMAQAFGRDAFPVDTHISRLAVRWGLSESKNVVKIEEAIKRIFPINKWHDLHIQMIEYGRKYCPARNHRIENCPICAKFSLKNYS